MPTMADMPDGAGPADDPAETDAASSAGHDDLSPIGDEARRALEAVIMVADQPIEAGPEDRARGREGPGERSRA